MAKRGKRTAAGKAKNGEADENGAAEPVEETPAKLAKVEDTESGSEHVVSETKPAKKSFGDTVKLLAWNVAGLRGWAKKDGPQEVKKFDADILFLGETKCKEIPVELEKYFKGYEKYMAVSSEKNGGYAGVALMSKVKPIKVSYGIGKPDFDKEGRLIIAEFDKFYLVGVYVPNSGRGLVNLSRRGKWDDLFIAKLKELDAEKPVILTGDLNSNHNKTAGFTDAEREKFTELLGQGFVDVYRKRNPELKGAYTFWSYMGGARAKNVGWRLDYFVTSERLYEKVTECTIHSETLGSDHCPLSMTFEH